MLLPFLFSLQLVNDICGLGKDGLLDFVKNVFTTYFYPRRSTGLFLSRLFFLFLAVFALFGYFLFLAFLSIFFTSIPWYSKHRDTFSIMIIAFCIITYTNLISNIN